MMFVAGDPHQSPPALKPETLSRALHVDPTGQPVLHLLHTDAPEQSARRGHNRNCEGDPGRGTASASRGGLSGIGLAYGGVSVFRSINHVGIPRIESVNADARIMAFAFIVSVLTGIAFSLAPALRMARPGALASLRDGGRAGGPAGSGQFRNTLVAVELGLAVVLMVRAGLFANSFIRME
ncbi:MAG: hypothetical protein ACKVIN_05930 [Longimicrobiales bacterium]